MSYDIYLRDPHTNCEISIGELGNELLLHIGVTYNYSFYYYRVISRDYGIRYLYDKSGRESIKILQDAIPQLGEDFDENYWTPTEGNARLVLEKMLSFALLAPHGIWTGD